MYYGSQMLLFMGYCPQMIVAQFLLFMNASQLMFFPQNSSLLLLPLNDLESLLIALITTDMAANITLDYFKWMSKEISAYTIN